MTDHAPIDSAVHHAVLRHWIDAGSPPSTDELSIRLDVARDEVRSSLERLDANHGVLLDPASGEVWLAHPFSGTPTLFHVRGAERGWFAPCIWCALGLASLVDEPRLAIHTRIGGDGGPLEIEWTPEGVDRPDLLAHFPIPPAHAWDNVHRHCACTLVFESEDQIDRWSAAYRIPRGEVLDLGHAASFASLWYGNHLAPDWRKPTVAEAQALFRRAGLTSEHWDLSGRSGRF